MKPVFGVMADQRNRPGESGPSPSAPTRSSARQRIAKAHRDRERQVARTVWPQQQPSHAEKVEARVSRAEKLALERKLAAHQRAVRRELRELEDLL